MSTWFVGDRLYGGPEGAFIEADDPIAAVLASAHMRGKLSREDLEMCQGSAEGVFEWAVKRVPYPGESGWFSVRRRWK